MWPNLRHAFFEDLARLHDTCGPWQAVFFTGDLTQRGSTEEFERLESNVLAPIFETLRGLGSADAVLLAVPGNHDLVRHSQKPPAALRQLLRKDGMQDIEEEFWTTPTSEYRQVVATAFANYTHWWETTGFRGKLQIRNGSLPGDFSVTLQPDPSAPTARSLRVGIVGLNTTFLQLTEGDYKRRLVLNSRQIHSVCDDDVPTWVQRHDACFLLTHQGPDWLDDPSINREYPEINPAGRFAVHLFGHMHENATRSTTIGGGQPLRQWQGCSLFGMEKFGEPPTTDRRHGYAAGRLELPPTGVGALRLWPRRAFKDANGWRLERDTEACTLEETDGGTHPEPLTPLAERPVLQPSAGSPTAVPPARPTHHLDRPASKGECSPEGLWPWPHDEPALRDYCEGVCKAHSHIRFVEIPHLKDVSDVELDNLFVEPQLSTHEIHSDLPSSQWPECQPAVQALAERGHVVLLGDPGSGKSTLASCLSWQLCRPRSATQSVWAKQLGGLVPFPMVLRELPLKADLTWEALLDAFLEHRIGRLLTNRKTAASILQEGRALVLLDGLDEIGNLTVRRKLRDAVHAGMAIHPDNRWLLTSRIVGYDQVPFHIKLEATPSSSVDSLELVPQRGHGRRVRTAMAELRYLAPFNDEQIRAFSLNWYAQHEKEPDIVRSNAGEFVEAIRENEGTQRLARIPYLLTLMALLHHKNARLPYGRTELYERIATAYLESIDLKRRLDALPYSLAQKKRWLADVAYRMQLRRGKKGQADRGAIFATKAEVQRWLRSAMAESGASNSKEEAESLIDYFAKRSGLLLPRGEGRFAFMHLSLQEYFAACFLEPRLTASRFATKKRTAEPSDDQLRAWANSSAWSEAFVLLFELLSEKSHLETEGLVSHLFTRGRAKGSLADSDATAAGLLSELATDPFVVLSAEVRRRMKQQCWQWVLHFQDYRRFDRTGNKVVRTLVRDSNGDLANAWKVALVAEGELQKVRAFDLSGCPTLSDLRPLTKLARLQRLSLPGCTSVSDLGPVGALSRLRWLNLDGCVHVSDLTPLAKLRQLRFLVLPGRALDLTPLATLEWLAELHCHQSESEVIDLSPLAVLSRLEVVCTGRVRERSTVVKVSEELRNDGGRIRSAGVLHALKGESLAASRARVFQRSPKRQRPRKVRNA